MKIATYLLTVLLTLLLQIAHAEQMPFDSLLAVHSQQIAYDGQSYSGDGINLILQAAAEAQFVVIAEEHNLKELNEFSMMLFERLHELYGYDYLAVEQGSVISSWFGDSTHRGDLNAIVDLVHRYPHAPTFATDEELQLIAGIGALSTSAVNPIWGVDQELGALHILERLSRLAPNEEARSLVDGLASEARKYELDRFGETHYLAQVLKPDQLTDLPKLYQTSDDAETKMLIEALRRTNRIYYNYTQSNHGVLSGYENGREREESMKKRFLEFYRAAQTAGDTLPKALVKLGHWHTLRGLNRANVPTFGNFLSEFAISNGATAFVLATYVDDSPDLWRNTKGALANLPGTSPIVFVDFRPLRPYAFHGKIADLSDSYKRLLFSADAALVIRGGQTGSYEYVRGGSVK